LQPVAGLRVGIIHRNGGVWGESKE
jgi:hypothetical protein